MRAFLSSGAAIVLVLTAFAFWTPTAVGCHDQISGCSLICAYTTVPCATAPHKRVATLSGVDVDGDVKKNPERDEAMKMSEGSNEGQVWFEWYWNETANRTDTPIAMQFEPVDGITFTGPSDWRSTMRATDEERRFEFNFTVDEEAGDGHVHLPFKIATFLDRQNEESHEGVFTFQVSDEEEDGGSGPDFGSWDNLGTTWGFVIGAVAGIIVAAVATNMMKPKAQRLPTLSA